MLTTIDVHKGLLLKHLPEYTIVGEYPIGKGTWALVYKGSGKNGPVAIKFLDKFKVQYEEMKVKARLEVKYLFQLMQQNEPNIILIYEFYESDQYLITVLELGNCPLSDVLMNYYPGGMPENLAKSIFFQMLSGVVALHKLNIIHRDLKLENIVVILPEGQQLQQDKALNNTKLLLNCIIKIIDLGVCKQLDHSMDLATSMAGTYSTMAPEVRNQNQGHKCSADMFSLGVLLIWLLIGHLPQTNFNQAYVYRSEFNGKISTEIDKILTSLLNHNPNSRPSAADLLNRLASWKQQPKVNKISLVDTFHGESQQTDVENKGIGEQVSDQQQDNQIQNSAPLYESKYIQCEETKSDNDNATQPKIENNGVIGQNQNGGISPKMGQYQINEEEKQASPSEFQISQQQRFITRREFYQDLQRLGKALMSLRKYHKIHIFQKEEQQCFFLSKTFIRTSFSHMLLTEPQKLMVDSDKNIIYWACYPSLNRVNGFMARRNPLFRFIWSLTFGFFKFYYARTQPARLTQEQLCCSISTLLVNMMNLHQISHPVADRQVRWPLLLGISLALRIYIHMEKQQPDTYESTYSKENEQNIHQYIEGNVKTLNQIPGIRSQALLLLIQFLIKEKLSGAQSVP